MKSSVFNNPNFGEGLAGLIQGIIGDPNMTAQQALMAAQAKQAAEEGLARDAMMQAAQGRDYGAMMLAALGAGTDYARAAPGIAEAMGFKVPGAGGGRSGGGGGRSGAAATPKPGKMTESEKSRVARSVKAAGFEGAEGAQVLAAILQQYQANPTTYGNLDVAAADILPQVKRTEGPVIDANDSWINPLDYFRGPERGPDSLNLADIMVQPQAAQVGQPASQPAAAQIGQPAAADPLADARAAIAKGASRAAVIARLQQMGVDPSGL